MSNKEWKLHSKKDVVTRVGRKCSDCDNNLLAGSYAKVFTYVTPEKEYKKKHICEECEVYYRRHGE